MLLEYLANLVWVGGIPLPAGSQANFMPRGRLLDPDDSPASCRRLTTFSAKSCSVMGHYFGEGGAGGKWLFMASDGSAGVTRYDGRSERPFASSLSRRTISMVFRMSASLRPTPIVEAIARKRALSSR